MDVVTVDLKKLSPEIHNALQHVREVAYSDGEVPGKHKLLVALAIAASVECEPCIRMYAEKAVKAGATREEAVEVLNVTMAMGGCVGEAWAHKALVAFESLNRKRAVGGRCSKRNLLLSLKSPRVNRLFPREQRRTSPYHRSIADGGRAVIASISKKESE